MVSFVLSMLTQFTNFIEDEKISLLLSISLILMVCSIYFLEKIKTNNSKSYDVNITSNKDKVVKEYLNFLNNEQQYGLDKQTIDKVKYNQSNTIPSKFTEVDKLPVITLVYASQSNTSKAFALNLKSYLEEFKIKSRIKNISEFTKEDFNSNVVLVFLISTYGEGEPTDDAIEFYKNLNENVKNIINPYLGFAIFGLGSKKYTYFCQTALNLCTTLSSRDIKKISATEFGDDSNNTIKRDFDKWKEAVSVKIFDYLVEMNKQSKPDYQDFIKKNKLDMLITEEKEVEIRFVNPKDKTSIVEGFPVNDKDYEYTIRSFLGSKECTLLNLSELRQSNDNGSTISLIYDITNKLSYNHGDNIGLLPTNDENDVMYLIKRLSLDPESKVEITKLKQKLNKKLSIISGLTVREHLLSQLNFTSKISQLQLKELLRYCKDKDEYGNLNDLIEKNEDLNMNISILDILKEFKSIEIPFIEFHNLCEKITPRYYTVVSSPKHTSNSIEIAISLVKYSSTPIASNQKSEIRYGLTSKYSKYLYDNKGLMSSELINSRLLVRESGFKLPSNPNSPLVMICTGTGVAPFISFLREMSAESKDKKREAMLIFGSKNENKDFIYKDELMNYKANNILSHLSVAFSRDSTNKKTYVQHRVIENKDVIMNLLKKEDGYLYICGGVNMGFEVVKVLEEILGIDFLKKLENDKRLFKELWG